MFLFSFLVSINTLLTILIKMIKIFIKRQNWNTFFNILLKTINVNQYNFFNIKTSINLQWREQYQHPQSPIREGLRTRYKFWIYLSALTLITSWVPLLEKIQKLLPLVWVINWLPLIMFIESKLNHYGNHLVNLGHNSHSLNLSCLKHCLLLWYMHIYP